MTNPSTAASASCEGTVDDIYTQLAYLYDGTTEGLLSAVFCAYARHEHPLDVISEDRFQPRLGQNAVLIATSEEQAGRVERGLAALCGRGVANAVIIASRSDDAAIGTIVLAFVRHALDLARQGRIVPCEQHSCSGAHCSKRTRCALSDITHEHVEPLLGELRHVLNERHRMLQFIRFEHRDNGVWFARCNPNASVVPLLMDSFRARFGGEPFVIFDETHRIAGVCDGRTWNLVDERSFPISLPPRAADEATMQHAWRAFYRAVSVEPRYHPELRRQFMPKRLWRNLTELQEELPSPALRAP